MQYVVVLLLSFFVVSCHGPAVDTSEAEKPQSLTLGTVQKRIQLGMTEPEVVEALGMPNIVSKDAKGKEAWVYDKIATEVYRVRDQSGVWVLVAGFGKESSVSKTVQKTLTVVIKFNDDQKVADVSYHATQF